MIRLTMSRRQLVYWLSSLITVPVVLFVAGAAFGVSLYIHAPQSNLSRSLEPADTARVSMLAAVETVDAAEPGTAAHPDTGVAQPTEPAVNASESASDSLTAIVATTTDPTERAPQAMHGFSVQIGSFSNEKRAESLAAQFRSKGYRVKTLLVQDTEAHQPHYKVRIGHYRSHAEAAAAAADYRRREQASAFVTHEGDSTATINLL